MTGRVFIQAVAGVGAILCCLALPASPAAEPPIARTAAHHPTVALPTSRPVRPGVTPLAALDPQELKSGDIIFRSGTTVDSDIVRALDHGSPFSHVGLVDIADDAVFVIHIEPGIGGTPGNLVRRETLGEFLSTAKADGVGLVRVKPEYRALAPAAVRAARSFAARHLPFDPYFSLRSDDALYCTELVWRAYLASGLDLLDGSAQGPALRGVVFVSALYANRYVDRIY